MNRVQLLGAGLEYCECLAADGNGAGQLIGAGIRTHGALQHDITGAARDIGDLDEVVAVDRSATAIGEVGRDLDRKRTAGAVTLADLGLSLNTQPWLAACVTVMV